MCSSNDSIAAGWPRAARLVRSRSPAPSARLLAAARDLTAGPAPRRAPALAGGHPSAGTGRIPLAAGRMKDRSVTTG